MTATCIVGPLPTPSNGTANQCEKLARLLRAEGLAVELVCSDSPHRAKWFASVPVLRAGFRPLAYRWHRWPACRACERDAGSCRIREAAASPWHASDADHRMAEERVIVSPHGSNADAFFALASPCLLRMFARVSRRASRPGFLQRVISLYGLIAELIPNIVELTRLALGQARSFGDAPHLVVPHDLEAIDGISTAIRAFIPVRAVLPRAHLTVVESGPGMQSLAALVAAPAVQDSVCIPGRVDCARMPARDAYRQVPA